MKFVSRCTAHWNSLVPKIQVKRIINQQVWEKILNAYKQMKNSEIILWWNWDESWACVTPVNLLNNSLESKHHKSRLAYTLRLYSGWKILLHIRSVIIICKRKEKFIGGEKRLESKFYEFFFFFVPFSFSISSQTIFFKSLISFKHFTRKNYRFSCCTEFSKYSRPKILF